VRGFESARGGEHEELRRIRRISPPNDADTLLRIFVSLQEDTGIITRVFILVKGK
jgi:hypothetical protein